MPIKFVCPAGHLLRAAEDKAERQVSCPICGQQTVVPARRNQVVAADSPDSAAVRAAEEPAAVSRKQRRAPPPLPGRGAETTAPPPSATHRGYRNDDSGPLPPPLPDGKQERLPAGGHHQAAAFPGRSRDPGRSAANRAYQPDRGKVQTVHWLAGLLAALILFSAFPALPHWGLQLAPGWARAVLLVAALQMFYVLWMVVTPDWSTVRVVMMVFAAVSALYGMATAVAIATPPHNPMPLGMGDVRTSAPRWCGAMVLLMSLATYLCGRVSAKWQRNWQLQATARNR